MESQSKVITWEELSKHITPNDCWLVIDKCVHNVSDFLVQHPGGDQPLMRNSGIDATEEFRNIGHSEYALSLKNARKIGMIQDGPCPKEIIEKIEQAKAQKKKQKLNKPIIKQKQPSLDREEMISRQVVKKHASETDCWIIIDHKVVNATDFLSKHPGGIASIMEFAGKDATKAFHDHGHSIEANNKMNALVIGKVKSNPNIVLIMVVAFVLAVITYFTCTLV